MAAVFVDKAHPPDDASVRATLGEAVGMWDAVRDRLVGDNAPIEEQWAWSGSKAGWTLRLARGGRPVAYLTPWEGECRASLALVERAVDVARGQLDADAMELIDAAPSYPEGRAIRLTLRTPRDVETFAILARVRMATP